MNQTPDRSSFATPFVRDISARNAEWCIGIFAKNEERRIGKCIAALAKATQGRSVHIVLVVNGSTDGTLERAKIELQKHGLPFTSYSIPYSCKSNAINHFVHELRVPAKVTFFIDGTTFVGDNALRSMAETLENRPDIWAASGLPLNGRGAEAMRKASCASPKLFGQMFVVRSDVLDEIARRGRKLPVSLYRGENLFVGFICFETDGTAHEKPIDRIATAPGAYWTIEPISYFHPRDVRVGFNRMIRQERGKLEARAWNNIIWRKGLGFSALPQYADEMILDWMKIEPLPKAGIEERIFRGLAINKIKSWKRPDPADLIPRAE